MRRNSLAGALVVATTVGCLPLVTTGVRTYDDAVSPAAGASLPIPVAWNTKIAGSPRRALVLECAAEASYRGEDDQFLAQYCLGMGYARNLGPLAKDERIWEGVSAGFTRLSIDEDATVGLYVSAATWHKVGGGIFLRYTFAPDIDGTARNWGTSGVMVAYYWGWLPSLAVLEGL